MYKKDKNGLFNSATLEKIKEDFPKGTKIRLIHMNDVQAVPKGTIGIVDFVDDIGTIHMNWATGSKLGLIVDEDKFQKVIE